MIGLTFMERGELGMNLDVYKNEQNEELLF